VRDCLQRYEQELTGSVIPFWERYCVDEEHGGYFNCLDRDGSVFDTDKHLWMQWRIVYTFATLAGTRFAGEKREEWLRIARHGFDFLVAHGRDEEGACYFALNRQGEPIVAPYDIGADFFAIMGSAALFKATGDESCKEAALASLQQVMGRLDNPKGQWNKRLPAYPERLAHGTQMATINLGLVLEECLGLPGLEGQVEEAVDLILEHFWRPEHGVILENLNPDRSVDLDSSEGRQVEPGHGLESAWLIMAHAERQGRQDRIERTGQVVRSILEQSWDLEHGGIFYFIDVLGRPHPELTWQMKLWWVHCEALVAALAGHRLTGDPELLQWFERIDEWTFAHFPDPEHGEWFGYLNRRGEPTHQLKGGKWKTLFHLPRALLECIGQLERL